MRTILLAALSLVAACAAPQPRPRFAEMLKIPGVSWAIVINEKVIDKPGFLTTFAIDGLENSKEDESVRRQACLGKARALAAIHLAHRVTPGIGSSYQRVVGKEMRLEEYVHTEEWGPLPILAPIDLAIGFSDGGCYYLGGIEQAALEKANENFTASFGKDLKEWLRRGVEKFSESYQDIKTQQPKSEKPDAASRP